MFEALVHCVGATICPADSVCPQGSVMRSSLVLASVTASSFGLYSCRARNQLGEAVLQLTLRPVGESSTQIRIYSEKFLPVIKNICEEVSIWMGTFPN